MSRKRLARTWSVLVLVLLMAGTALCSAGPYEDARNGFSLTPPPGWSTHAGRADLPIEVAKFLPPGVSLKTATTSIFVYVQTLKTPLTVDEYFQSLLEKKSSHARVSWHKPVPVGKLSAIRYQEERTSGAYTFKSLVTLVAKGNRIVTVTGMALEADYNQVEPDITQCEDSLQVK